jgi:tetratricopeptide (TPR) repeat protein
MNNANPHDEHDEQEEHDEDDNRPALPDEIHEEITQLCAKGDELMENEDYNGGYSLYVKAYQLVPEPREDWEATTFILVGIADARFFLNQFEKALEPLNHALHCPGGFGNPFIHLRLGQCYFEVGDLDHAAEDLCRAYMGDGRDIFESEDPKYLAFLATRIDPPAGQDTL